MNSIKTFTIIFALITGTECGLFSTKENKSIVESVKDCFEGYADLGCFANVAPWYSLLRPFPAPLHPKDIDAKIYLYTTAYPAVRFTAELWEDISINGSDFNPQRPYTAFITHGFASNGNMSWVEELKNAYLRRRDANVFIVDWGKGASVWNYLQVAANTRVVGAELRRFGKYLVDKFQLDPARIHLMGHSLGAHISSIMAKGIPGVGQLTAFDPAQPGFEGTPNEVRLHKTDANFIDVIHTNARPVIPFLGFGLILPTGHVDYYMNGGLVQPGCVLPPTDQIKLNGIADLGKYSVEIISSWVACSHGKSYEYYIEALLSDNCTFWGRNTGSLGNALDVASFGKSGLVMDKISECSLEKCSPIGLDSRDYPARGTFFVGTNANTPYCRNDLKIANKMRELRQLQLENPSGQINNSSSSKLAFKNIFG